MKILYLFSGSRKKLMQEISLGESPANGMWGMTYLSNHSIHAEYKEIEDTFPSKISRFIRKYLNVYFIHIFYFFRFFSYDIIFTSAAFGTQLIHTVLGIKRPIWVMHDFSIMSMLGEENTFKQKLFRYMVVRAGGVITLSLDEKVRLQERFSHLKDKIDFIPFGIDMKFFKPMNIQQQRSVLSVGRDPDRDWKTLVDASTDPSIPVTITTFPKRVQNLLPLPSHIQVLQLSSRDLVTEYDKAGVLVIALNTKAGINDAMGCSVLYEAMAMGKAIIATRTR
nr:hypothetical protein [Nitrosopumilus sp.]